VFNQRLVYKQASRTRHIIKLWYLNLHSLSQDLQQLIWPCSKHVAHLSYRNAKTAPHTKCVKHIGLLDSEISNIWNDLRSLAEDHRKSHYSTQYEFTFTASRFLRYSTATSLIDRIDVFTYPTMRQSGMVPPEFRNVLLVRKLK